jgi:tetrahydromethanopterin S-methyltransferase subunit E
VLLVPWVFLCAFAGVYAFVLLPRMRDGAWLALCFGAFVAFVFLCFFVAAVTFSRDVLAGRWPE